MSEDTQTVIVNASGGSVAFGGIDAIFENISINMSSQDEKWLREAAAEWMKAAEELPEGDKEDAQAEIEDITKELAKGENADQNTLRRRIRGVWRISKAVARQVVAGLIAGPVGVAAETARLLDEKFKEETA